MTAGKPKTNYDNLPSALTSRNAWLVWKFEQRAGEPKPRKVPYYVSGQRRSGEQGSDADRSRLADFQTALAAYRNGGWDGIGIATLKGGGLVALDFDNVVKDGVIDPRVAAVVEGTYTEYSPSGRGIRAFMLGDMHSHKDIAGDDACNADGTRKDGKFDFELFGDTGFVTVTGNTTEDTELFGLQDTVVEVTQAVKDLYRERFNNDGALTLYGGDQDDLFELEALPNPLGWTLEYGREILFGCDASADRSTWIKALMAVHHEFGGSPEALDLCDEWSITGSSYAGRRDVETQWRSFGRRRSANLITGRWLLAWYKDCQVKNKYKVVDEIKSRIASTPDVLKLREEVCPEIAANTILDDLDRETLAQALCEAFTKLGNKYPIAQCRKLVAPRKERRKDIANNLPEWLRDWVYVSDEDKFYRIDSDEWLTMQGFNARFNRELPRDDDEGGKSAAWVALEDFRIPTVTRARYLPWADALFDLDGVSHVNKYRHSSVPQATEYLSVDGKKAVEIVKRHVGLICGHRPDVSRTLLDWMAHNVQRPGVKVRWAPLIKGIEGDGKTVLGTLLAAVMGRANVRNVSPKVLGTDFTGWAEGSCVAVLEEIKLTGHNRYDILNALKPFVTNDSVEIHRKGQDPYDSINTTNYIAFTNYPDALPLTDTDRRWWIVFSPFTDRTGLAAAIRSQGWGDGSDDQVLGAYFELLNNTINTCRAELRRWLLDWKVSDTFRPNGSAPMTQEKAVMIGMNVSDEEMAIKEALEKGGVGISQDVFASSYLRNELINSGAEVRLETTAWNHALKRIGYTRVPKKVKWRGGAEVIWVRGHANWEPQQIRARLDKTVRSEPEGSESDDLF